MINKFKEMAKREDGFTLVELLVVILIIAILAAAAVAAFLSQQDKARESSAQQAVQTAYKSAKAESVFQDGNFVSGSFDETALAAAIEDNEPGLDGVEVGTPGEATDDGVIQLQAAGDDLTLAAKDGDTPTQVLVVTGNGAPVINP